MKVTGISLMSNFIVNIYKDFNAIICRYVL